MKEQTLVIGANGALGSDLMRVIENPIPLTRPDFNLLHTDTMRRTIQASGAKTIINTAAFHDVPLCERDPSSAYSVNAIAVAELARICSDLNIHLCHISTDYVFDGSKNRPYQEQDLPCPKSQYAISKLAGEHAALTYGKKVTIVRSCGLYGWVPTRVKGDNFVTKMMKLGRELEQVTVVQDEVVAPTFTLDLAHAIAALLQSKALGLFHISASGSTSWYGFAQEIWRLAMLPARLLPTTASNFQSVVKRPAYSILDNTHFQAVTGFRMPAWDDALRRYFARQE